MAWTQVAADNFTRTNENPLSDGGNWHKETPSALQIVSNKAEPSTSGSPCAAAWTGNTFGASQYSEVTIGTSASTSVISALVYSNGSTDTGYISEVIGAVGGTRTCTINLRPAGTVLATTTHAVNAGDIIRLEVGLNAGIVTLYMYLNGTRILSATDTANTYTSGSPGLLLFDSAGAGNVTCSLWAGGQMANTLTTTGLIGQYAFSDDSGTTLTDASGSGNNGTLGSAGNAPTWIGGSTHGLSFAGGQFVTLPAGMNLNGGSIQAYLKYNANDDANTYSSPICGNDASANASNGLLLTKSTNGTGANKADSITGGARLWTFGPAGVASVSRSCFQGTGDVGLVMDTVDHLYVNGVDYSASVGTGTNYFAQAACGAQSAGNYQIGGAAAGKGFASQTFYTGTIYYLLVYNRVLSFMEMAGNSAALQTIMTGRGVAGSLAATDANNIIVADGDSITMGYNGVGGLTPYTSQLSLTLSWKIANQGRGSIWVTDLVTFGNRAVDPFYHPSGTNKLCIIWAGTNDMAGIGNTPISPASAYAKLQTYCTNRKAAGWKTMVVSMLSRTGTGFGSSTMDSLKDTYNSLIAAGVGTDFDFFADLSTSAVFNMVADGAYANTTYFQDGVHPTQTAINTVIAPLISSVINSNFNVNNGNNVLLGVNSLQATNLLQTTNLILVGSWVD